MHIPRLCPSRARGPFKCCLSAVCDSAQEKKVCFPLLPVPKDQRLKHAVLSLADGGSMAGTLARLPLQTHNRV